MNLWLDNLTAALNRLPGVGRRSAERMAMYLVEQPEGLMQRLATALLEAEQKLVCCERCGAITESVQNPCPLCTQPRADQACICVVESPADIMHLEHTGVYQGRYHALMGKLSAMHGVGAQSLRVDALLTRIPEEGIEEIIIALGSDVESEATVAYLCEQLKPLSIQVTRVDLISAWRDRVDRNEVGTLEKVIAERKPVF